MRQTCWRNVLHHLWTLDRQAWGLLMVYYIPGALACACAVLLFFWMAWMVHPWLGYGLIGFLLWCVLGWSLLCSGKKH